MARPNAFLVISDDLRVDSLIERVRPPRWRNPDDDGGVVTHDEPALPRSDDGVLTPGVAYPSSDGSRVRFYVPTYVPSVVDGRYLSSLKWRAPTDDPDGPIAFLTVVLDAVAPSDQGPLVEVDHIATVRLLYDVEVSGADGEFASQSVALGALTAAGDGRRTCRYAIHEKGDFDRIWEAMTKPAARGRVEVHCSGMVARRTWRQIVLEPSFIDRARLLEDSAAFVSNLLPLRLEPEPDPIVTEPDVFEPVTEPIETEPVVAEPVDWPIADHVVDLSRLVLLRSDVGAHVRPDLSFRERVAAVRDRERTRVDLEPVWAPNALEPRPVKAALARDDLARVFLPDLQSKVIDASDAVFAHRPGIPFQVVTGIGGEPATLRVTTAWTYTVGFSFDVDTNAYMFDVPGDLRPTTSHVLLRGDFDPGGGRAPIVYYQDSALPTQFSYEPQEFLIPRSDTEPYLPALQLAFLDVVSAVADGPSEGSTEAPAGQVQLRYRVRMAYRLVASIDRFALAELQRHVATIEPGAQLHVLSPEQAALRLRLPRDAAGGEVVEEIRPVADVTFDDGIVDEVDLSPTELEHIIAQLQSTGVLGHVDARLVGSTVAHLPVRLSLRETTGPILGRAYRGPVGDGLVRVSVHNRIESPVRIDEMYRSAAGSAATAYPQSALGLVITPNETIDLDYRVDPAGSDVADVDPVLELSVQTDLPALLPRLMVNRGYASETFPVTVEVDPSVFGQVAGSDGVLIALRVEFEGDASALLDAESASSHLQLRIPMLSRLLRLPDAKTYRYRVVNLHGAPDAPRDGSAGPWVDGAGDGRLTVTPVAV